ncbi:hypothetical protein [Ornithinimicrobium murale]|uniref:hypothetical protein n=1 Tax=Ornithinimicrobium murale TaxID=1050153 RepID=UPI000E0DD861|nr:hypothetical protein [Ornithinimicrobium murale]
MPNSLIFVVILAVWAAYLIQHWIRRRDHVATARSVDRFSEAMRVLERRQSMPRADISTPKQRSYSVSLTRPAHPDVVVKRARHGAASAQRHGAAGRLRTRPSATTVRAAALIAGVVALVVGLTLSVTGTSWWAALAGVAALLLAVTFVRFSVEATRRQEGSPVRSGARRPPATATRPTVRRRPAATRPVAERADRPTERRPAPRRRTVASATPAPRTLTSAASTPAAGAPSTVEQELTSAAPARATALYDIEAFEPAPAPPAEPVAAEHPAAVAEPEPGTWAPVPVPPPTYTLKARAPRREEPRTTRSQRPLEDLPFDGHALALDEEFEDLPPVHSAG